MRRMFAMLCAFSLSTGAWAGDSVMTPPDVSPGPGLFGPGYTGGLITESNACDLFCGRRTVMPEDTNSACYGAYVSAGGVVNILRKQNYNKPCRPVAIGTVEEAFQNGGCLYGDETYCLSTSGVWVSTTTVTPTGNDNQDGRVDTNTYSTRDVAHWSWVD